MMTNLEVQASPRSTDLDSGPGDRLRRLRQRRRLIREEFLAVVILFVVLGVTVAVLATQWLGSTSPSSSPAVPRTTAITLSGGST